MHSTNLKTDSAIVSQIQLYKAFLHQKVNLNYEISYMKIKKNYIQSNSEYRDLKEFIALSKVLLKRLNEIRQINRNIRKNPPDQSIRASSLNRFLSTLKESDDFLGVQRSIFSLNFALETQVESLKEKFEKSSQDYEDKLNQYRTNEAILEYNSEHLDTLNSLEQEIYDIQVELYSLNSKNKSIQAEKQKKTQLIKNSLNTIKNYQKLSENALKLRSKLQLQENLNKSISITEHELHTLNNKVELNRIRLKDLESESSQLSRLSPIFSQELSEWNQRIQKLQSKLDSFNAEKSSLLSKLCNNDSNKEEDYEEEDTEKLSGWNIGFEQMAKDKEKLMDENKKLKDRISRLTN